MAKAKAVKKSFEDQLEDASSFHEVIDLVEAHEHESIKQCQERLKKRDKLSMLARPDNEARIRGHEATLASLAERRQRFDSIQGNKKIPATLRKWAAHLEMRVLILEHKSRLFSASSLRSMKKELAKHLKEIDRHLNPPKAFATTDAAYKIGEEYPRQSLTRAYDGHVWQVLEGHFEAAEREKGQRKKVEILAALPDKTEYLQLKQDHFTKTFALLVEDAYEKIADLRDEMQEAFDNTPESLQETEVAQARSEAASQLENIADDSPSVPEPISSLPIIYYPSLSQTSRADRAGDAAAMLRHVAEAARQFMAGAAKLKKAELKEIQEFCGNLEAHADEIEDVTFPGMFG